jgi:adenosine deaminase
MRDHGIDVETNLTSNWQVLGLTKNDHPWSLYHQTGVPTTISTDDAGIERIDLTHEYQKMVTAYDLNYYQLKSLIRNNLTYSFLPGESLWLDQDYSQLAKPCRKQTLGADQVTQWCQTFLAHNQKAQEQWRLEKAFRHFEATMAGQ